MRYRPQTSVLSITTRAMTGATVVRPIIVFQVAKPSEWVTAGVSRVCYPAGLRDASQRVVIDQTPGRIFG